MTQRFYCFRWLMIAIGLLAGIAEAQVIDKSGWVPNGPVFATEQHGNIMYVGGAFDHVGKVAPFGLFLDATTGAPDYTSPALDGGISFNSGVSKVLSDGQGGFFITGGFQHIGGVAINGFAYLKPDGSVSSFNPALPPKSIRRLLAVNSNHVFVDVEWYDAPTNKTYYSIFCLDYSGNVVWSKQTNDMIFGGAISGNTLFITGRFTVADGMPRNEIAAFDESLGTLLSWNPGNVLPKIFSNARLAASNSELYICYSPFSGKHVVTSFDLVTGQHNSFTVNASTFTDILFYQGKLYVIGYGISYNGITQPNGLIVFDAHTKGVVPNPIGLTITCPQIYGLSADGNSIYLSGDTFVDSNSGALGEAIALDATTQALLPFSASTIKNDQQNISPGNYIFSIAAGGGKVYAGGDFTSIVSQARNNLYAYDVTTGALTSFAPYINGPLSGLHATATTLFIAGSFDTVDGQSNLTGLASFDLISSSVNGWSPVFDSGWSPDKLTGDNFAVYIAGPFSTIDGISRNGVASFDNFGALTSWIPFGVNGADAIAVNGSTICVAAWTDNGNMISFFDANGQPLHPAVPYQGTVYDMAVDNGVLYMGGNFTGVGGQPRSGLAAVDITTSTLVSTWNPVLQGSGLPVVNKVSAGGGTVYIAGIFNSVNSTARYNIAALDEQTGQATNWNVIFNDQYAIPNVYSLYYTANNVYIGGDFQGIDQELVSYLAAFSPDHSNVVTGTVYYDLNSNGVFDAGDNVASNILMEVQPLNLYYPTDAAGKYKAFVGTGNYTIRPISPTPAYTISVSPGNVPLSFASELQVSNNNDFAIKLQQNVVDMSAIATIGTSARPGFPLSYSIDYKNVGTAASNGQVTVTLDPAIQFDSSMPGPDAVNGNILIWNYASLAPGTGGTIKLSMELPPNVLLGKDLVTIAAVSSSVNDSDNTNNTSTIHQTVVGSYDPNDKQVSPQGQGDAGFVPINTNELIYTIRFQNKGTADAVNIRVVDELDGNVDVSSFKMISASHAYTYQIVDGVVKWNFSNVNLPFENEYTPDQSNGYITYSVVPKANLAPGSTIQNGASIYFDFNPAVATNTVVNTISSKSPQVIAFDGIPTTLTYGDADFKVSATGGASGNPVVFMSSDDNIATVKADGTVSIKGAGMVDITANQVGNSLYLDAPSAKQTLIIGRASQTILNFGALGKVVAGAGPITLSATADSGLPVTYSSSNTNVSIAGNVITILSTGSTTITAHQIGDVNHSPTSQNQTLEVDDSRIISATSLDFGDHLVGASGTTQQLIITNTGTGPLTISDIHLPQGYTINNTSGVIASQALLSLPVTFVPQASVDYTGVVTITSDATSGAGTAAITGRGSLIAGLGDEVLSSSAYPNPSKGIFTLALVDCDGTGTLIDEEGRVSMVVLHQLKKDSYQLDLSDQSDGIYLFKYYSGGVQRVIRMVKR